MCFIVTEQKFQETKQIRIIRKQRGNVNSDSIFDIKGD